MNIKVKKNSEDDEESVGGNVQHIHLPYFESTQTSRCLKLI